MNLIKEAAGRNTSRCKVKCGEYGCEYVVGSWVLCVITSIDDSKFIIDSPWSELVYDATLEDALHTIDRMNNLTDSEVTNYTTAAQLVSIKEAAETLCGIFDVENIENGVVYKFKGVVVCSIQADPNGSFVCDTPWLKSPCVCNGDDVFDVLNRMETLREIDISADGIVENYSHN